MRSPAAIRKILFLIMLTGFVPAVCIILYSGAQDVRRQQVLAVAEGAEFVRSVAFRRQSMTENMRTLLVAVSNFDEVAEKQTPAVRAIFRTIVQQTPYFSDLRLVDADGALLAGALPLSQSLAVDPDFLIATQSSRGLRIGPAVSDPQTGEPALLFSYSVGDGRAPVRIVGGLKTRPYSFAENEADLPGGAVLRLLDASGAVFYSHPRNEVGEQDRRAARELLAGLTAPEGRFDMTLENGAGRTLLYRRLYIGDDAAPYMTVLLSIPSNTLLHDGVGRMLADAALLLAAALAACALMGYLGVRSLQRPVRGVLEAARRLRLGDYSARADMSGVKGEMGRLASSFNSMAEAIEERDRERFEAKKLSDEYNQAKSAFLAAMSHAIRTPMNSVIGISYLLMKTQLNARQHGYVSRIYSSASTLLGIINDILDFSNIESGRFAIERQLFSLDETLDAVMHLHSHKAEERRLLLRLETAPDVPRRLYGDPLRLTQILTNLVGNAVKFTEQGGIVIRCETAAGTPCPDGPEGPATALRFTVEDTGIGMTEGQVASLFDAYVQADDSIARKYGGTGLGLAISRRLVQLMGGEMEVVSRLGTGTSMAFTACFGIAAPSESGGQRPEAPRPVGSGPAGPAVPGAGPLKSLHVLLVEDNPVNQEIAAELLRGAGARVSVAGNGAEALDALTGGHDAPPVDLVLMDVQMPVMDGYEATRRIRAMDRYRKLPIIAMTAHAMTEERERCLLEGMDAHIAKPIEIEHFFSVIAACVQPSGADGASGTE